MHHPGQRDYMSKEGSKESEKTQINNSMHIEETTKDKGLDDRNHSILGKDWF